MNDGNTALPVSPVTKEEAMSLSSMFAKAAEMMVQASSLPSQLAQVQFELDRLRNDYAAKTTHAEQLDQSLREMREQRDTAENEVASLKRELGTTIADAQAKANRIEDDTQTIDRLRSELLQVRKDRDDALMHSLELEDQVKVWKTRADQGRAQLAKLQDLFKPDPEPEPVKVEPAPTPDTEWHSAFPSSEPEPFQGLPPSASPPPVQSAGEPEVHPGHSNPSNWSPTSY